MLISYSSCSGVDLSGAEYQVPAKEIDKPGMWVRKGLSMPQRVSAVHDEGSRRSVPLDLERVHLWRIQEP